MQQCCQVTWPDLNSSPVWIASIQTAVRLRLFWRWSWSLRCSFPWCSWIWSWPGTRPRHRSPVRAAPHLRGRDNSWGLLGCTPLSVAAWPPTVAGRICGTSARPSLVGSLWIFLVNTFRCSHRRYTLMRRSLFLWIYPRTETIVNFILKDREYFQDIYKYEFYLYLQIVMSCRFWLFWRYQMLLELDWLVTTVVLIHPGNYKFWINHLSTKHTNTVKYNFNWIMKIVNHDFV